MEGGEIAQEAEAQTAIAAEDSPHQTSSQCPSASLEIAGLQPAAESTMVSKAAKETASAPSITTKSVMTSAPKPTREAGPGPKPRSMKPGQKASSATGQKSSKPTKATKPKSVAPMLESPRNTSIQKPPAKPTPAGQLNSSKPPNSKLATMTTSSKTSGTAQASQTKAAAVKTIKTRTKSQKARQPTAPAAATRPTLSDGNREREIWQPADGNGDPTPKLIEESITKKKGHPTWKFYTGRNVPKIPTDTNPPRFVVLDDNAAWTISNSKKWTKHEKHRYWPFDFTLQGRISFVRPNRSRPAYEKDGKTYAWMKKRKEEKYIIHGCHPPPKAGEPNSASSTAAGITAGAESSETAAATEKTPVQTAEPVVSPPRTPDITHPEPQISEPEPAHPTPPPSAPLAPVKIASTSPGPEAALPEITQLPPLAQTPSTRRGSTASPTPRLNDADNTSPMPSVQSVKRSASPDNLAAAPPKRQRKSLIPHDVPASVAAHDSEVISLRKALRAAMDREAQTSNENARLVQQVATQRKTIIESAARLAASEKKAVAFRDMAKELYANSVDSSSSAVDRHTAMLSILKDTDQLRILVDRLAVDTRREMQPTALMHSQTETVLDKAEQKMREQELGQEYDNFVEDALNLDS